MSALSPEIQVAVTLYYSSGGGRMRKNLQILLVLEKVQFLLLLGTLLR